MLWLKNGLFTIQFIIIRICHPWSCKHPKEWKIKFCYPDALLFFLSLPPPPPTISAIDICHPWRDKWKSLLRSEAGICHFIKKILPFIFIVILYDASCACFWYYSLKVLVFEAAWFALDSHFFFTFRCYSFPSKSVFRDHLCVCVCSGANLPNQLGVVQTCMWEEMLSLLHAFLGRHSQLPFLLEADPFL